MPSLGDGALPEDRPINAGAPDIGPKDANEYELITGEEQDRSTSVTPLRDVKMFVSETSGGEKRGTDRLSLEEAKGRGLGTRDNGRRSSTVAVTVEVAACREKEAAAKRIQTFLLRRRKQRLPEAIMVVDARTETTELKPRTVVDMKSYLDTATRALREAVDGFLQGTGAFGLVRGSTSLAGWFSETRLAGDDAQGSGHDFAVADASSHEDYKMIELDANGKQLHAKDYGYDLNRKVNCNNATVFARLPARARTLSLYTLYFSPNLGQKQGCRNPSDLLVDKTRVLNDIHEEISVRISKARSIFCLRGIDVLTAFVGPHLSTATQRGTYAASQPRQTTAGQVDYSSGSSPGAIRRRLQVEAQEAASASLGRTPGFPWKSLPPPSRRPVSINSDATTTVGSGRNRATVRRKNNDATALTALGRRLLEKRQQAARRKRFIGQTDVARIRHAGRNLWCGAVARALNGVMHGLDKRMLICQQHRELPIAHVKQLLDTMDRLAFCDSQVTVDCPRVALSRSSQHL